MKVSTPFSREHLHIKKTDYVLDVGGGHEPHERANVVVDKYDEDNNYHRNGNIKVYKNQRFLCADGGDLPFKDKEFDFSFCCHVLEHVDDPGKFVKEIARVSKRGYMETPSLIGEYLAPKQSHRWVIQEIDNKLVMYEKDKVGFKTNHDFGDVFLEYMFKNSLGYRLMIRNQSFILTNNYEWKDDIEILVNPPETRFLDVFTKPWNEEIYSRLLQQKSAFTELKQTVAGMAEIAKSVFLSRVLKKP